MTYEYVGNPHVHSLYSDGHATHDAIAAAAIRAGLDFVIVTDHNVWVDGMDGYRYLGKERVLLLTGEEIHDQVRDPQKNHLLVYETRQELAPAASNPQALIDAVRQSDGFSFIAHPVDPAAPLFGEDDLSWEDWNIKGFAGLEIWNFMSEFKSHLKSMPAALYYAYKPSKSGSGPFPETLQQWDRLLARGQKVAAIGGADAHGTPYKRGPLKREILPYEFLFRCVNTHVLTPEPLSGNMDIDRQRLFHGISQGRCFVGFDLPASTRGFRFNAQGERGMVMMGESIRARYGVTLQVKSPLRTTIRLIRNGEIIHTWPASETAVYTVSTPGAYRIEVFIEYNGGRCGWIYSNPIYVTD